MMSRVICDLEQMIMAPASSSSIGLHRHSHVPAKRKAWAKNRDAPLWRGGLAIHVLVYVRSAARLARSTF